MGKVGNNKISKNKCDFCKSNVTESLNLHTDAFEHEYLICDSCRAQLAARICRRCKGKLEDGMEIVGCCLTCAQADINKARLKEEESRRGLGISYEDDEYTGEGAAELTEEQFDYWMTHSDYGTITPDLLENHREYRYIYFMVKLSAVGIYDNKLISDNYDDLDKLFDRNITGLRKKKFRIVINDGKNTEILNMIRNSDIIDSENNVYILDKFEDNVKDEDTDEENE